MYCSHCGAKAGGNFCSACGSKLVPPESGEVVAAQPAVDLSAVDVMNEDRYEVLIKVPRVRDLIARHAAEAIQGVDAEKFLELSDKAFAPLTAGVPVGKVASLAVPLYAQLGIQTNKQRSQIVLAPIGMVLVTILCFLARTGRPVKEVHQAEDGCLLEATLPLDLLAWEGKLILSISRQPAGTQVEATAKIPGSWYDWGKSDRALNGLFDELNFRLIQI